MKIKMARKKWFTPKHMRSFRKLCHHVEGHYPKDRALAVAVKGCFASFDECATKLARKSKSTTSRRRTMRRRSRRMARRFGTRRMRSSARFSGRRSWRRSRRSRRAA
jgi:hypothetical protein